MPFHLELKPDEREVSMNECVLCKNRNDSRLMNSESGKETVRRLVLLIGIAMCNIVRF